MSILKAFLRDFHNEGTNGKERYLQIYHNEATKNGKGILQKIQYLEAQDIIQLTISNIEWSDEEFENIVHVFVPNIEKYQQLKEQDDIEVVMTYSMVEYQEICIKALLENNNNDLPTEKEYYANPTYKKTITVAPVLQCGMQKVKR